MWLGSLRGERWALMGGLLVLQYLPQNAYNRVLECKNELSLQQTLHQGPHRWLLVKTFWLKNQQHPYQNWNQEAPQSSLHQPIPHPLCYCHHNHRELWLGLDDPKWQRLDWHVCWPSSSESSPHRPSKPWWKFRTSCPSSTPPCTSYNPQYWYIWNHFTMDQKIASSKKEFYSKKLYICHYQINLEQACLLNLQEATPK